MNYFLKQLTAAAFALLSLTAQAAIIHTIDLTPINGTTWNDVFGAGVQLDFGPGIGTGRIFFSNPQGGAPTIQQAPDLGNPFVTALDGGNQLVSTQEVVFDLSGSGSFFTINIALNNNAVFTPGSVFIIRSLDRSGTNAQYFTPGGLIGGFTGVVDSHQLPSSESFTVPLVQNGSAFSAASDGISLGRAFYLTVQPDPINFPTFVFGTVQQDVHFGGMAFSIAVPTSEVPVPASAALVFIGAAALLVFRRQRDRHRA